MTDTRRPVAKSPTAIFFDELAARRRHPLVRSATGTIRFDVLDGDRTEHWSVALHGGEVDVGHDPGPADAVVRLDRQLMDGMVDGTVNAMAATLRGSLVPEGDLGLVMSFQRLFGSTPTAGSSASPSLPMPAGPVDRPSR